MNGRMHARMCYVAYMDKVVCCVKSASKGFWLGGEDEIARQEWQNSHTHNSQATAQEKRTVGWLTGPCSYPGRDGNTG